MSKPRTPGFTLIELLTVIAIIAILVGITAAVLPGVLERAKIARTQADFAQIRTALVAYSTDYASYPPGYGYRLWTDDDLEEYLNINGEYPPQHVQYNIFPYMQKIKLFRVFGVYDANWAENYDTNRNSHIDLLEFNPVGVETSPGRFDFPLVLYNGANLPDQTAAMMREEAPFIYVPVNKAQALKFRQFCESEPRTDEKVYARVWDDSRLGSLQFPPRSYDAFVLISPGPGGSTSGVVPADDDLIAGLPAELQGHMYYINALRAYYLATRDLNRNSKLDFDFIARSREGETEFRLPDGTNGYGPLIYVGQ